MKDLLIAALLAAIVVLKALDLRADMTENLPASHLAQEWALLVLSLIGFIYLVIEMRRRTRALERLKQSLSFNQERVDSLGAELRAARAEHGKAVRREFQAWKLTESEQQVAMLMLKGLSLKEVAAIRDTREKTVRQQASNIYAKSGIDGRHALAAWFLEDFLFVPATGERDAA
ncbi:MAG: LuxR C-terminal-related transcriptional regulator [Xanthomonadales bacterium]|jgi:DNA-binding CsgD family transcriptional regulator|nr:LuxR C-terminal-related transcriptional regulator [Xanthomonadales bacterium]